MAYQISYDPNEGDIYLYLIPRVVHKNVYYDPNEGSDNVAYLLIHLSNDILSIECYENWQQNYQSGFVDVMDNLNDHFTQAIEVSIHQSIYWISRSFVESYYQFRKQLVDTNWMLLIQITPLWSFGFQILQKRQPLSGLWVNNFVNFFPTQPKQ